MSVRTEEFIPEAVSGDGAGEKQLGQDGIIEFRRQKTLLKAGA